MGMRENEWVGEWMIIRNVHNVSVCLQYVVHELWLQFTQPRSITFPYKLYKKASSLPVFVEYFTTVGKLLGGGKETAKIAEEVFKFESSLAQVIYVFTKKPLLLYCDNYIGERWVEGNAVHTKHLSSSEYKIYYFMG